MTSHLIRLPPALACLVVLLTLSWTVTAAWAQTSPTTAAQSVKLPVSRDTWISSVERECAGSNGGAARMKLKSNQEMSLVDFDPAPLKGRIIQKASLHLRTASETTLKRITVSSCSAEWFEGTATGYASQSGASTFLHRRHPDTPWSFAGSDFCSVVLGQGNSIWQSRDAAAADSEGWQEVPIDPAVVAARLAGLSYGFLIFDDTGSEWKRDGEKFTEFPFPNRFFYSREQGVKHAPYVVIQLGAADQLPPQQPSGLLSTAGDLPRGEAWLSWLTPADEGAAGTLGFNVSVDGQAVPRYLIPRAGKAGERVVMHLRDFFPAERRSADSSPIRISISAVDAAGNTGPTLNGSIEVFRPRPSFTFEPYSPSSSASSPQPHTADSQPLVKLGQASVAIIDELDKVQPITGEMIPPQSDAYLKLNHLWNAHKRLITLRGARKECIAFQVLLGSPASDVQASLTFEGAAAKAQVRMGMYSYVGTDHGPMPDPIVPLPTNLSIPAQAESLKGQKYGSIHVEIEIPETLPAGLVHGSLKLRSSDGQCELPVELQVWNFTLPDRLSFLPEMNCYGLPRNEIDYYRLAHQHRTVLNRVPYSHRGTVDDGCAPLWHAGEFDWTEWDKRFGPLFDGTAFDDLPRAGVPVECFYLPLFENWPIEIGPHYNEGYWADSALSAEYREGFMLASQRIAEHIRERGWNDTLFHFYLNGKNNYKQGGWSRSTSPWLLDEPAHFQDFWALRWFGTAFHEGINRVSGPKPLVFRADISRPQWQRDTLDGVLDYNVVGSAVRKYRRAVLDRRNSFGEIAIEYGTSNRPDQSNIQPLAWCVDAWSMGMDGVLPWQTVGNDQAWKKGSELALFYPPPSGQGAPLPSVRLKAYRRGQQDVEYLTLVATSLGVPRLQIGQAVRNALHLDISLRRGTQERTNNPGNEDAGRISYGDLLPQEIDWLRTEVAAHITPGGPQSTTAVTKRSIPQRHVDAHDSNVAVRSDDSRKRIDDRIAQRMTDKNSNASELGPVKQIEVHGAALVDDCILNLDVPDKNFGNESRNNPVRRAEVTAPFLLRFELSKLPLASSDLVRARLMLYVWDPSGQGNTKVAFAPLRTPWKEMEASWMQPSLGSAWNSGANFNLEKDSTGIVTTAIVAPDAGDDLANPPREIVVDITPAVKQWLERPQSNLGLAVCPVIDRTVDEGHHTRFQVYSSEYTAPEWTPRLVIDMRSAR